VGDLVTVLESVERQPGERCLMLEIGIAQHAKRHGTLMEEKGILHGSAAARDFLHRSGRKERIWIIDEFLVRHLSMPMPRGADDQYKICLAIAQLHMRLPLANATEQLDGLWYPSVAVNCTGTNVALLPAAADRFFKPHSCTVFHVVDQTPKGFAVRQVRGPASVADDGRILW